ncbi:MAG: HAD family hydrolase [bacterium]
MNQITKYNLVVFDLDGTLIDSKETIYLSTTKAFELISCPVEINREQFNSMIGMHFKDIFTELNIIVDDLEAFLVRYKSVYFDYIKTSTIYPGVVEILEYLVKLNVKIALLTTKGQDQADKILNYFDLAKYFNSISGRVNGLPIKPAPDPLLKICNDLNTLPAKTLIVGDTELDIQCGKNALANTCAVTFGYRQIDFLRNENPDFIIDSFWQIKDIITN